MRARERPNADLGGTLWLMNADISGGRALTTSRPGVNRADDFPSWAPDGRFVAFSGTLDGETGIHVANFAYLDGGGPLLRIRTPGVDHNTVWIRRGVG